MSYSTMARSNIIHTNKIRLKSILYIVYLGGQCHEHLDPPLRSVLYIQ